LNEVQHSIERDNNMMILLVWSSRYLWQRAELLTDISNGIYCFSLWYTNQYDLRVTLKRCAKDENLKRWAVMSWWTHVLSVQVVYWSLPRRSLKCILSRDHFLSELCVWFFETLVSNLGIEFWPEQFALNLSLILSKCL
jgi:hypothetical protein